MKSTSNSSLMEIIAWLASAQFREIIETIYNPDQVFWSQTEIYEKDNKFYKIKFENGTPSPPVQVIPIEKIKVQIDWEEIKPNKETT